MDPLFFLLSLVGVHRLAFVERKQESEGIYSFVFKPTERLHWAAGQHFVFWIPNLGWHVVREQLRAFSVSSCPSEGCVTFTTRYFGDKGSVYKRRLFNLKPGSHIIAIGPLMWFYLRNKAPLHIGIAGGIGITPLRSVIKEMDMTGNTSKFVLFYQNMPNTPITFKEDLDAVALRNPNITFHYPMNPDVVTAKMIRDEVPGYADATFYISGSPGFVHAMEAIVTNELGLPENRIVQDSFWDFRERFVNVVNALIRKRKS